MDSRRHVAAVPTGQHPDKGDPNTVSPSGGGVVTRNVEMELLESHSTGDVYFRLLDAALEGHIADHMTAGAAGAWKKARRAKS